MRFDEVVVGSGLAALVATRRLQLAGRRPVLIWPGLSSLYFVYATIDVLGYLDAATAVPVGVPDAGIASLIAADPSHPFARAGHPALRQGVGMLVDWLKEAGLDWQGSLARNILLPTAIGTAKPSCLVPASMAAGDLEIPNPIVLCGFEGYEDFVPELAASNLSRAWAHPVQSVRVQLPGFHAGRQFSSIDVARRFEDEAFLAETAQRVLAAIAGAEGFRIGVPAVLGLTRDREVHARFQDALGRPVFEIPTLPPSVPALRLFDRLRKHLQEGGVEVIWGAPAHAAEVANGRCLRISIKSAGKERPVEGQAYVLALEDAVDGAFRAGTETIHDPFFLSELSRVAAPAERTSESLFEPQPFASTGYRITNRMQPAGEDGRPLAGNVFVAGGAIAGYDPTGTKSRGGLAIATGYRAAQEAMVA